MSEVLGVDALREALSDCVARGRRLDVRAHGARGREDLVATLVPEVESLLRSAIATFRRASDLYDEARIDEDEILPRVDGLDETARREIADVAFIGMADLGARLERLRRAIATGADVDELRDECQRARRRALRGLAALDVALAHEDGVVSSLTFSDELVDAIATRRHYARLRRAILGGGGGEDVVASRRALERVRLHMLLLVKSDVYAQLRLVDRRQLDVLLTRIEDALATNASAQGQELQQERLFQDLVGFAGLIAQVSRREELVEHDARVVWDAHEALARAVSIPPRLRARLEALAGLDDEIDGLIEGGEWSIEAWRSAIERQHTRMIRPETGRLLSMRAPARRASLVG